MVIGTHLTPWKGSTSKMPRIARPKNNGATALLETPVDKRLSLVLSSSVYKDLNNMAKERRTTMTEIIRLGLGLVKVAMKESKEQNKLVVTTSSGEILKELVLPG